MLLGFIFADGNLIANPDSPRFEDAAINAELVMIGLYELPHDVGVLGQIVKAYRRHDTTRASKGKLNHSLTDAEIAGLPGFLDEGSLQFAGIDNNVGTKPSFINV